MNVNPDDFPVNLIQTEDFQQSVLGCISDEVRARATESACAFVSALLGLEQEVLDPAELKIKFTFGARQAGNHVTPVCVNVQAFPADGFTLPEGHEQTEAEFFEELNLMLNEIGEQVNVPYTLKIEDDHDQQIRTIYVLAG